MKEFTIGPNDAGQRLDRFLAKAVPLLPASLAQKYIRIKRIKCNGKRVERDTRLQAGDVLQLYINDEFFDKPREDNAYLTVAVPKLNIVYEDENILLVDKRPGLAVHPHDGAEYGRTLIDHIQSYLYQKREWRPREENAFTPALCNRIDRFTGGIVIAAKNEAALKEMDARIRSRQVEKFYLCAVAGRMVPPQGELKNYLLKEGKRMRVLNREAPGAQAARTRYRTLATDGDLSLLECQLLTGRTHQIRAQFAAAGHPLIGDTQYGDPKINQAHASHFQQLYSYRIVFRFTGTPGPLEYLNGQSFQVKKLHRGFEEIVRRMPE